MSEDFGMPTVDSRGRRCPQPVIDLASAARGLPAGERIRLLADDPGAAPDVRAWCRMRGHVLDRAENGEFVVLLCS